MDKQPKASSLQDFTIINIIGNDFFFFGASLCSCERLIKKHSILMNWVDYPGKVMVVQGCVSLQKSIGTQAEHKAALTLVSWDMTVQHQVRVGRQPQQDCSSAFCLFSRLYIDHTAPPFNTVKYSLSEDFMKHIWDIFLRLSLKRLTLADFSWKLWYLMGSPQHQIFMSILDGN